MKTLIHLLMFLILATPVLAQSDDESYAYDQSGLGRQAYGVACTDHYADWQSGWAGYEDSHAVPAQQIARPAGTTNRVFRCRIGGHAVRMVFGFPGAPLFHCGAATNAELSAWVDGVKVVDRRQWGTYDNCMVQEDRQLARVLINDRLHLTVCDRLFSSQRQTPYAETELKPGQRMESDADDSGKSVYYILECRLSDIAIPAGAHDLPDAPTSPALVMTRDTMPACRVADRAMTYPTTEVDDSLDVYTFPGISSWSGEADWPEGKPGAPSEKTYSLDIDNDSIADTVTIMLPVGYTENLPRQFRWISGSSGATYALTSHVLGDDDTLVYGDWTDPLMSDISFVIIKEHTYLYVTALDRISGFTGSLGEYEDKLAVTEGDSPSRQLFELHPDGTASGLCSWAPRKRPEEFL